MRHFIASIMILFTMSGLTSCEKFFDIQTEDFLPEEESYQTRDQIYSGMLGLYANLRTIIDDYIILSELRGDLLEPTVTAPDEYWDIYRYKSDMSNKAASPAPLYQLVLNCNDFLRHIVNYNVQYPGSISTSVYKGMVAAAIGYRTWAYMNIGKLYGEAYYHDLSVLDLNQPLTGTLLQFDDLIDQLIYSMRIGVDGVNAFNFLDWRLIVNPDQKPSEFDKTWYRIAINPDVLLCELYLWDGDYTNAAKTGINAIAGKGLVTGEAKLFKMVDYSRENWKVIFNADFSGGLVNEAVTAMQYAYNKRQTNKLQYYFSNYAPNIYRFKPVNNIMSMFSVADGVSEKTGAVISILDKFRGAGTSYGTENGEIVVTKYSLGRESYRHDATIYVYRASEIHLMVAEALNGIGNTEAADSLLSVGLKKSWSSDHFLVPFDAPIYDQSMNVCPGVLGRAGHKGNYTRYYVADSLMNSEAEIEARRKFVMDSLIGAETARELAFEGKRWFTLMRMARNSKMPEKVANVISKKFDSGLREHYRTWLMEPKNWFIKWDHSPENVSSFQGKSVVE
ncbi:MAG: RagB/SusD family nutrient uptake outer membrane protein [Marinifilaceae bacterium]